MRRSWGVRRLGAAAAVLVPLLACDAVQAARPLVTEDAGVLDRGDCEFEGVGSRLSVDGRTARSGLLQVACGIGIQTQLSGAFATTRIEDGHSTQAAAGGKTSLRDLTDEQVGVALAYTFIGTRPSGMGWRYDYTALLGVVTVPMRKDLLVHLNLGASRSRIDEETNAIWAVAAEFLQVAHPGLDLVVETFGNQRDPLWLNAGVRYAVVPERFTVNASFGVQGGSGQAKLATIGFKLNF